MNATRVAQVKVAWFNPEERRPSKIRLDLHRDGAPRPVEPIGVGLDDVALDLVDCAAVVFHSDRSLTGRMRTNLPVEISLTLPVRAVKRWTPKAREALAECLGTLGYVEWHIDVRRRTPDADPDRAVGGDAPDVRQVALFSGGMDSTCGVGSLPRVELAATRLVSFYTKQKTQQREIAEILKADPPIQWTFVPRQARRRGHAYLYRSFLYLAVAAASARALKVRKILQFENGVLAHAVPLVDAYRVTRHAQPTMLDAFRRFVGELFEEEFTIWNPFLYCTKREAVEALKVRRPKQWAELLAKTETCWAHGSPRGPGEKKDPGRPCGACIPCLIRRTALPFGRGEAQWNLHFDKFRNDDAIGADFRAVFSFADRLRSSGEQKPIEFFQMLDNLNYRRLADGSTSFQDLRDLYRRFADEFCNTYRL